MSHRQRGSYFPTPALCSRFLCVVGLLLLVAFSVNTNEFDAYKANWLFLNRRCRWINIISFPINRTKLTLCNGIPYVSHEFLFLLAFNDRLMFYKHARLII